MTRGFRDDDDEIETFTIKDVRAVAERQRAVCCQIDGDDEWIPKSQIADASEVYAEGHFGKLVITAWLARERGWL